MVDEVYNEVLMVSNIDEDQKPEVYAWFLEKEQQFTVLKKLPMENKNRWIMIYF